ncbi:MAG: PhoH family protein [Clostridia bacterium]|jgi:phosphate starvation-inducible PhoH-like protein|nr:PhoH family protein [Clostridia bacterium]
MAERSILTESSDEAALIYGAYDANITLIEQKLDVKIYNRSGEIVISGESAGTERAYKVLCYLKKLVQLGENVTEQKTEYVISMITDGQAEELDALTGDCICITAKGKPIKAKTVGQKRYVETIRKNTIVLGVGPAGTGKTFLAVAMAVAALRRKEISRIILTRPAVEAGEKLGYLPGDLQNKIDPYLRPLYDALYETMGPEGYARNLEKGIIEVAPLAYMRGRTLDDSFIILDEAQNTTQEQMKMFLTRLGVNSKAVVTGDLTQTDLPFGKTSGLAQAIKILDGIEDIGIHHFTGRDVVRHRLVQKIIEAYEKQGKENAERPAERRIYRKREQ